MEEFLSSGVLNCSLEFLSPLEAECIDISQGMCTLISARSLSLELGDHTSLDLKSVSQVLKACEDSMGTQNLVKSKGPLVTSWTKYIGIKYHWLRSNIQPDVIQILHITTKQQRVDILTKSLT